jgi:gliding motility-associated-like protein
MFRVFTLLIFMWLGMTAIKATHLAGGEMSYVYLGDDLYEFTLVVYRDCGPDNTTGVGFDTPANIGVYAGFDYYGIFYETLDSLENVELILSNPCLLVPDEFCMEKGTYVFTLNLPSNEDGYHVVYQRCCRNPTIINVQNAGDAGLTLTAFVPGKNDELKNSCPTFDEAPPFFACVNDTLKFSQSATDIDGDELRYRFYTPLHGASYDDPKIGTPTAPPHQKVVWENEYSLVYPLDGNPGLTIDETSGELNAYPNKLGKFVVGIAVDEYRNGVLLSTIIRDFFITVTECPSVESKLDLLHPDSIKPICDGLSITLTQSSVGGDNFIWTFFDTNEPVKKFGTVVEHTFAYTGRHLVHLEISTLSGCNDSTSALIDVYPKLAPDVILEDSICMTKELKPAILQGFYEPYAYVEWDFGEFANPRYLYGDTVSGVSFETMGSQQVYVTVDQDICTEIDSAIVFVQETPIPNFTILGDTGCVPFELYIEDLSQTTGVLNYTWNFGDGNSLNSTKPEYVYETPGEYEVSVEVHFLSGCADTFYYSPADKIKVYETLIGTFDEPDIQCLDDNIATLVAIGNFSEQATLAWNYTDSLLFSMTSIAEDVQQVSYISAGLHPVMLSIEEHECISEFVGYVEIQHNPEAHFSIADEILCIENEIHFINESTADTPLEFRWYLGEKEGYSSEENPRYVYYEAKMITVNLTVFTTEGCIDTSYVRLDTLIPVHPLPDPNFTIANSYLDIWKSTTYVTNLSDSGIYGYYVVLPTFDTILGLEQFNHTFEEGKYEVWQTVVNRYGCIDSTKRLVEVLGHTLYVPNAFTPNKDQINDGFRAFARGVTDFKLSILDRWGNVVFESDNQEERWFGELPNGTQAKSDVYTYQVKIQEIKGFRYEYIGRVSLIR